jgi:hypothetical protein
MFWKLDDDIVLEFVADYAMFAVVSKIFAAP